MRTHEAIRRELGEMSQALLSMGPRFTERPRKAGELHIVIRSGVIPPILGYLGISDENVPQRFYAPLARELTRAGHHVTISRVRASSQPLAKTIRECNKEGPIDVVIGHSLGGIVGYACLAEGKHTPRLAITLGSPVLGTPWLRLARWVEQWTGITPALYEKYRPMLLERSSQIVSISATNDAIAPPDRCAIKNETRRYPCPEHRTIDVRWKNPIGHTGLATNPRVFEIITRIIHEKLGEEKPAGRARLVS